MAIWSSFTRERHPHTTSSHLVPAVLHHQLSQHLCCFLSPLPDIPLRTQTHRATNRSLGVPAKVASLLAFLQRTTELPLLRNRLWKALENHLKSGHSVIKYVCSLTLIFALSCPSYVPSDLPIFFHHSVAEATSDWLLCSSGIPFSVHPECCLSVNLDEIFSSCSHDLKFFYLLPRLVMVVGGWGGRVGKGPRCGRCSSSSTVKFK